jgi:hypothetical protein
MPSVVICVGDFMVLNSCKPSHISRGFSFKKAPQIMLSCISALMNSSPSTFVRIVNSSYSIAVFCLAILQMGASDLM